MTRLDLTLITEAAGDAGTAAGIRIRRELEPLGGHGAPIKPAVYEGGRYQLDKRWESVDAVEPVDVIVIGNVPAQANVGESAAERLAAELGLPVIVLDLSSIGDLPSHLPASISSWQFPHRAADAYLRDSNLEGVDFTRTGLGKAIFQATPWKAGALLDWFPQALLFGYWQSHLGKKRANTKHARAWVSEIIGWRPATTDTKTMGLKGDPLNLSVDEPVNANPDDRVDWGAGREKVSGGKTFRLSEIGHGQVPFMKEGDATPAGVSFARITQQATVSFAQLRRVSVGTPEQDAVARALLTSLGLLSHTAAFGSAFALRSGADLVTTETSIEFLGADGPVDLEVPSLSDAKALLTEAVEAARSSGLDLEGWGREPLVLTPKDNLATAIRSTWPLQEDP